MLTDPDGRCPACTSDPQGISTVEFYANDWLLATDTTAPYSYTRSDLPGGSWTLRARAYDSYGVAGWSAPVSVTVQAPDAHGPAATETLPVPVPITVTVEVSGTGTGTVTSVPTGLTCVGSNITCTGTFTAGAELDLTATPDTGMTFVGWAGACRGTTPVCTIAPGSDVLVVARFAPPPPPVVLTYYHTDVLGSVRAITDVTGATVARHDYFAFGESTSSMAGDPRRFTGKERDAETALDYFGARYYRNLWGRFTSVDPVWGQKTALEDPQRWNRYTYVGNRPYAKVDPDGRGWMSWLFKAAKVVVKGADLATEFAGIVDDAETLVSRDSGLGDRTLALASLASELLSPVSGRDAVGIAKFAAKHADDGAQFVRDTRFRDKLVKHTGIDLEDAHAHHILPIKFGKQFMDLGVNPNDPRYGAWWSAQEHLRNSREYNRRWEEFFRDNRNPTAQQVIDFGWALTRDLIGG